LGAIRTASPPSRHETARLHVVRDVPRQDDGCSDEAIRSRTDRSWLRCRSQLVLLDLGEQESERSLHDRRRVAARNLPAQQLLKPAQVVVAGLSDRELDAIALGGGVLDDRPRRRRQWRAGLSSASLREAVAKELPAESKR
jgi:hypothetical protein